jgi:hypothetical protein
VENLPILLAVLLALIIAGALLAFVLGGKAKKSKKREIDAPLPSQAYKKAARPPATTAAQTPPTAAEPAATPSSTTTVATPTVEAAASPLDEPALTGDDFVEAPAQAPDALDGVSEDEDWGADIALASDQDEDDDADLLPEDEDDSLISKELEDISAGTRQAFTQAIIDREFSISKMREADETSQKCVQAYLEDNEVPNARKIQERLFVIHPKIQVSDLPEFAESYLDDGSDNYQENFAELEEMCEAHEESVLDLFLRFNSTLPEAIKCSIVGEVRRPVAGVVFLAPEWDDGDFAKPDFGDDEAEIGDDDDFYEDYYDDLEEIDTDDDDDDADLEDTERSR